MISHSIVSLMLLAAPPEPAKGLYTREELDTVIKVGFNEFDRMKERCVSVSGQDAAVAVDVEAELAFVRMAELVQLVISLYPYQANPAEQRQHSDDVRQAVQGYERAYACNPGWERREYLNRAIALLEARILQIRDGERRSNTAPDWVELQEDLERLRGIRKELRAPAACPVARPCPTASSEKSGADASPRRGYRGRLMDLLSLRIEFAGGFKTRLSDDRPELDDQPQPQSGVVLFSLAPGLRFLAGKQQRHVFGLGFHWALLSIRGDVLQQFTARFEYGIRLHKRWLSIHAAFEPGLQARTFEQPGSFGRAQIGGSGALCSWNEAFCVRVGGFGAAASAGFVDSGYVGAGFDVFRVADNLIRRSDEP